ncbi:MAG: DNA-deoxyinosine glycosylase [Planctomycetia bacterium]|jgi:hypoxanthine-DNA glycosylase
MPPKVKSFPPIETPESRILILGTMPGVESLRQQQYYAFKQNAFWPIMGEIWGFDPAIPYDRRCEALRAAGVALWDVLKSCRREGSLDSRIEDESVNDFPAFFAAHPRIERIFFNGGPAEQLFRRHARPTLPPAILSIETVRLPSTSPANASWSFSRKLAAWQAIR